MPKPVILVAGVVGAVVVIGGAAMLLNQSDKPASTNNPTSSNSQASEAKLDDPDGTYKVFSDPSVTKYPEKNVEFGNGQTLTFEYDGSKTANDPDATLSYQLYYIQKDGKVQPMGGGNMEGDGGKGTFTVSNKVFNSSAKGTNGFLELQGTYGSGLSDSGAITGKNVTLGMYPIKFTVSD